MRNGWTESHKDHECICRHECCPTCECECECGSYVTLHFLGPRTVAQDKANMMNDLFMQIYAKSLANMLYRGTSTP